IRLACNIALSVQDSLDIADYLISYFDSRPNNFLRLIIASDLQDHPDLLAIGDILDDYSCNFNEVALEDPFSCLTDSTVSYSKGIEFVEQMTLNNSFSNPSTLLQQKQMAA